MVCSTSEHSAESGWSSLSLTWLSSRRRRLPLGASFARFTVALARAHGGHAKVRARSSPGSSDPPRRRHGGRRVVLVRPVARAKRIIRPPLTLGLAGIPSPSSSSSPPSRRAARPTAMDALRAAANAGDARAMSDLGATYAVGGEDVEQSWSEAFRWFTAASEAGSALATMNLAGCYREGNGCAKDEARAVACYRAVAEDAANPEPDAMEVLGEIYSDGACGVERDLAEAARWFSRGAAAGSVECSYRRGVCLATGAGLALDYPAAVAAFTAAANAGHAGAALDLGHCLMNGLGAAPDADLAAKRYRVAADAGSPEAAYHLAMAHVAGRLGARSSDARPCGGSSARGGGHVEAMGELARRPRRRRRRRKQYSVGSPSEIRGTLDRDRARAVEWYRRAAALGHAESAAARGRRASPASGRSCARTSTRRSGGSSARRSSGWRRAQGRRRRRRDGARREGEEGGPLDAHDRLWAAFEEKLERRRRGQRRGGVRGRRKRARREKKNADAAPSASAPPGDDVCRRGGAVPGAETRTRSRSRRTRRRRASRRGGSGGTRSRRGRERVRPGRGGGGRAARGGGLRAVPETEYTETEAASAEGRREGGAGGEGGEGEGRREGPVGEAGPFVGEGDPPAPATLPTPPPPENRIGRARAKAAACVARPDDVRDGDDDAETAQAADGEGRGADRTPT